MGRRKVLDFVLAYILVNVTLLSGTLPNFLDIEELKNIHYDIDISENPVVFGRPLHTEVVYLSSKYGQRYECQIPDVGDVVKDQEEEKIATETGISELLKPMENLPCLQKTKGWWTYEFCYGKHVQQFHLENMKKTGETITLGIFESEMDWGNKSHSDSKRHRLNRYHSHKYVNGSKCDLTGQPREVEVRFLCAENQLDTLSRVDEPQSCHYVITIHTMRICHHPYLKPLTRSKPKSILCYPLLMPEQYDEYMHRHIVNMYSKEAQTLDDHEDVDELADGIRGDEHEEEDDLELLEEHNLQGYEKGSVTIKTPDGKDIHAEVIEVGPDELTDVLAGVLDRVKGTLASIDDELSSTKSSSKMPLEKSAETNDQLATDTNTETVESGPSTDDDIGIDDGKNDLDDDEEYDDEDIDFDDDEDDLEQERKKFDSLMKTFRDEISQHPNPDRFTPLTEEIEATFNDLEEMDRLLREIDGGMKQFSMSNDLPDDIGAAATLDDDLYINGEVEMTDGIETTATSGDIDTDVGDEMPDDIPKTATIDDDIDMDEKEMPAMTRAEEGEENGAEDDTPVVVKVEFGEDGDEEDTEEGEEEIREMRQNIEDHLAEALNKLIGQLRDKKKPAKTSSSTSSQAGGQDSSNKGGGDNRVRVRITRVKVDKEHKAKSEQELKFYDMDHQDIEEAISDRLEKAGLEWKAQYELRVLSYVPEDWPDQGTEDDGFVILSDEESKYFKNMIFGLVARGDQEEQEKQDRLMKNYEFKFGSSWDSDTDHEQLDRDEIQILVPSVGTKPERQTVLAEKPED